MKIILLGDSTIQTYPADRYPQTGWGQVFPRFLKREVEVLNFGKGGCSTKSFHDEGRLKSALTYLKAGDYVFIQFGHNDQKFEVYRKTEPFTSYLDYLKIYLNEIKNKGGNPVLLSSIYRRHFDKTGQLIDKVHGDFPEAMRILSESEAIPYLDICSLTARALQKLGDEASKMLFMNFGPEIHPNYPEGSLDNTHLSACGAYWVSEIVSQALKEKGLLSDYL